MSVKNTSTDKDSLVSIILPVYNGGVYLKDAVQSLLNQTYQNIEIICINDGSEDDSLSILCDLMESDDRIKIISRRNKGLIFSLNEGIMVSSGNYIARMDADDISESSRIEKQVEYLSCNPKVNILGTFCTRIDFNNNVIGSNIKPISDSQIKAALLFQNPIIHPSVMLRGINKKDLFFDSEFKSAEDYELWLRLSQKYIFHNLPEQLLKYRVLESSITRTKNIEQRNSTEKALEKYLLNRSLFCKKRGNFMSYIYRVVYFKNKNLKSFYLQVKYLFFLAVGKL